MNLAAQKVTFIIKKAIVQKQLQWKQVWKLESENCIKKEALSTPDWKGDNCYPY